MQQRSLVPCVRGHAHGIIGRFHWLSIDLEDHVARPQPRIEGG
jgi:hypothetical protein